MKNKITKLLLTLMAVITMMTAFSVPAFAQVPDNVANEDAAPPETEQPKEEEKKEEKKEESKPLTPDGNLTLVDDISSNSDGDKQFLTVVSKNGNYFYIIVDRTDNGENNVHFLNLVDERDLEDLIDDELSINKEPEPVIVEEPTPQPATEPEPEPVEEPKKGLSGGAIFGSVILLLALAGGGFYYFKFVRPQNNNGNPDDLSEYDLEEEEDDEELEVEEWDEDEKSNEPEEKPVPNYFKQRQEMVEQASSEGVTVVEETETVDDLQDILFEEDDE